MNNHFSQRRYSDGQQAHEKMLNTPNHPKYIKPQGEKSAKKGTSCSPAVKTPHSAAVGESSILSRELRSCIPTAPLPPKSANNHKEILPHICQNSYYQRITNFWQECREKGNLVQYWWA